MRDEEVIAAANEAGMAMVFTGICTSDINTARVESKV